MNTLVCAKMVPDLVEELEIDATGTRLDTTFARLIVSEFDDHAIEQGILIKEALGGAVTVVGCDDDGMDDVLLTAAAKGADRLIKLVGLTAIGTSNKALVRAFGDLYSELKPDLILTGVQAHNDLDGSLGGLLAGHLKIPYVGYVSGISAAAHGVNIRKEYPGGLVAQMEVPLPAVLGIQAAEQPPRYVAVSKVRQAMKAASIEERKTEGSPDWPMPISRMYKPESAQHASMLTGTPEEVANKLVTLFKELGVLQGGQQ